MGLQENIELGGQNMSSYIEVKNVSQIYSVGNEPVNALTNISFAIEKGEFIAVTGPSGCGKSTLPACRTGNNCWFGWR